MKKFLVILLAIVLAGCSNSASEEQKDFKPGVEIPFEIAAYMEDIAPIYMNQVPYIAYAKTEGQLTSLKKRFKIENFDMDMDKYFAVFVVSQSNSCGIVPENVYNDDNKVAVQLIEPSSDDCDVEPMNHTFVIQVEKADYEKVQLYNGNILKSSMDIKE